MSTKQTVFSILTRKSHVPRHKCPPLRPRSQLRGGRSQLAAPAGPGSQTLPRDHCWGSQAPRPQLARRLLRQPTRWRSRPARCRRRCHQGTEAGMGRGHVLHAADGAAIRAQRPGWGEVTSCMLQLRQMAAAIRAQRLGWGRGSLPPEGLGLTRGQPWQGLCSPAGHSPQPVRQPEAEWAGGLGEQDRIHHFSPSSPDNHHSAAHWLNEPLTCAHWQLVIWGRGSLQQWPVTEQGH